MNLELSLSLPNRPKPYEVVFLAYLSVKLDPRESLGPTGFESIKLTSIFRACYLDLETLAIT